MTSVHVPQAHPASIAFAACALALAVAPAAVDGALAQRGFVSKPTDQIAVPGATESAEITPEGDLYTGWAEYELRFGRRLTAWDQPTRTLPDPSLPLFSSTLFDGRVRYTQTIFAVPVGGRPIAYDTVVATNRSRRALLAQLAMEIAYTRGAPTSSPEGETSVYRYARPATGGPIGSYSQPGETFSPAFSYTIDGRDLDRSKLLLARGPAAPGVTLRAPSAPLPAPIESAPGAVHDARLYRVRLAPHAQASFTWQIPLRPPAALAGADRELNRVPVSRARTELRRLWQAQERGMAEIYVPEPKVRATYRTAIAQILDSRVLTDAGWEQCPNHLQYQAFWIRDAALETRALDLVGLHEQAAQNLAFLDSFQQPSGLFLSQAGQYDALGEALWAIGEHALFTRDSAYAFDQLAHVEAAVDWLAFATAADPMGLLPPTDPNDDELAYGHITGDDLWAAAGLRAAIATATLAGRPDLASAWVAVDSRFEKSLDAAIEAAVAREGHIPPVLDAVGGQDWGNFDSAFPSPIIDPHSPQAAATVSWAEARMAQGLATYGDGQALHDYLGFRTFETELAAGDPGQAVAGLYAELAHTTSTDAGWELMPNSFAARASTTDLSPHGVFAAEYVTLLRNLLVEEAGGAEVVLLPGASPAWLAPGEHVTMRDAPTSRGTISFTERSTAHGETLNWRAALAPATVLKWALPWWAKHARLADGKPIGATVSLAGKTGSIAIRFGGSRPELSYARAVTALNEEFRAHGAAAPLIAAAR